MVYSASLSGPSHLKMEPNYVNVWDVDIWSLVVYFIAFPDIKTNQYGADFANFCLGLCATIQAKQIQFIFVLKQ